jgi:hypothetical protein
MKWNYLAKYLGLPDRTQSSKRVTGNFSHLTVLHGLHDGKLNGKELKRLS